jgi:ferredoxin
MKPVVNHKKCFADIKICTAKLVCPVKAIGFEKVEEPMLNKTLTDKTDRCPFSPSGLTTDLATPDWKECKCGIIGTEDNPVPIGDPYIRVVIDYDKCIHCELCIEGCCGYAIEMIDDN